MARAFLGIVCGLFCGTVIACGSSSGSGTGGSAGTAGNPGAGAGGASGASGASGATGGSAGTTVGTGGAAGSTGTGGCATGGVPGANSSPTCQALNDCETTKCSSQLAQCFGAGYANGNFAGGQCQALAACIGNCNCNSTCVAGCSGSLDATCTSCLLAANQCITSICAAEQQACTGMSPDAGLPSLDASFGFDAFTGGGTCTDLRACCATLSGTQQTQCNTVAGIGIDAACGAALTSFRMAGLCQ